jgi:hypothetical protein
MRFNPWSLLIAMALAVPLSIAFFISWVWTLIVVLVLVVVVTALLLWVSKTKSGAAVGQKIAGRLYTTRVGKRLARSQLRAEARKRGVPLLDATGRERSEIELQLDLFDTPETRLIKQQLKGMNPVQRAQALRMMEAQAEAARVGGQDPAQLSETVRRGAEPPRPSGRPVAGPPRSRSRKRRRH